MLKKFFSLGASFLFLFFSFAQQKEKNIRNWFPNVNFTFKNFQHPPIEFAPFTRWWWPGNLVDKFELKREINLFADNGFGGVEIQPLNRRVPVTNVKDQERLESWDTKDYYDNLATVMDEARSRKMTVDITNGSGWPPGGSFLSVEDGFMSLEFSKTQVNGGSEIIVPLIKPNSPTKVEPKLIAVLFAKQKASDEPILLDSESVKIITSYVSNDTLKYLFPDGKWQVISFWTVRTGETTEMAASAKQGPILNHFDSVAILKFYRHLYGDRTALEPYFGNPMRAVFSDSYEFQANRFYAFDFIKYFKSNRGYDPTTWLPANMQKGYNYVIFSRPESKSDFSFSNQDWRLRYDYDLTLNDLLRNHFFKTSRNWAETRNLLFRTQAYGLNMDMIAMAGQASIPETESMLGAEANLKVMSSGALLYNKPIVSAEAVVFAQRAYTTTPQKIRLAVDKLFAAGVNQIIYHGVPYKYVSDKFGPENWYLFSSPLGPHINFSSNLGEGNIFWKDQKAVNDYVSKVQYAMRSGKAHADVLIYYPYLNVEGMPDNNEEIMTTGYLKEVEGPLPPTKKYDLPDPLKVKWAEKVYSLINKLEAAGISWAWVNDESIQNAKLEKDNTINIRGNLFSALVLANDSIIQVASAKKIKELSIKGMRLLVTDIMPMMQPSYLDWNKNDSITAVCMAIAVKQANGFYLKDEIKLEKWVNELPGSIKFKNKYSFIRQAERVMPNGGRIKFIWNKSNSWQTIFLEIGQQFKESYWMDADKGLGFKNKTKSISYQLAPYSSVILYASTIQTKDEKLRLENKKIDNNQEILNLKKWDIQIGNLVINDTALFDWRNDNRLKYTSDNAIYKSTFDWNPNNTKQRYFLDLGSVCYTAVVYINNKFVGKVIYSPFILDITKYLVEGRNAVDIRITPSQLNGFIGKANNDDGRYLQFKGKNDQVMAEGLLGPVVIRPQVQSSGK